MRNIARSRWTQVVSLAAVGVLALSACSSSDRTTSTGRSNFIESNDADE